MSGSGGNPRANDGGWVQRQELFISYSRKDRAFLEQFWTHLKPLETLYGLQRWDDSRIKPGDVWLEEIEQALSRAQVALLLVSPDFLASDFIQRKELPSLFNAAKQDRLKILWLPIRPCSWKRYPQIGQYQSVGSVNRTLAEMGEVERDRVMVRITDQIHDLFERIEKERKAARQAAEAEASSRRQEEERRISEQNARREAEESARLESLNGENNARAEPERWKAEAERLAMEKEDLQRQANLKTPQQSQQYEAQIHIEPQLIQIPATCGWLVREGNEWRKKEELIKVLGYREELAEGIALTMIQISAGEFLMGSPVVEAYRLDDESPHHRVRIGGFFFGQTPVTRAQWEVVAAWPRIKVEMDPDPSGFGEPNHPVVLVNWQEAVEFCQRLNQRTRRLYSLPSESQWEYACRAGTTTPFAFGETLTTELANYLGTFAYSSGPETYSRHTTTDVFSFPSNAWGLHDMHGNVLEWCKDHWHESYHGAPTDGIPWIAGHQGKRVLRGGCWNDHPMHCRSARRKNEYQEDSYNYVGFRVCCI